MEGGVGMRVRTRPASNHPGAVGDPLRAPTCRCDGKVQTGDGLCLKCGKWPRSTVDRTFNEAPYRRRARSR